MASHILTLEEMTNSELIAKCEELTQQITDEEKAFTRGVALALAEISSSCTIEQTLSSCGIKSLQDLEDAEVADYDMDRLRKFFEQTGKPHA